MIVVSDTSPISNLILIDRLVILRQLFAEIFIPPAVHAEIAALKLFDTDLREYENSTWIKRTTPENFEKVRSLQENVDEDEAQAIALALEIHCDLLLMDERIGTAIARNEGLRTVGLIGVLLKAKESGIVPAVRPIVSELKIKAGFWLHEDLEKRIFKEANED